MALFAYGLLVATLLTMSVFAAIYSRFQGDVTMTRKIQALDVPGLHQAMRFSTYITSPEMSLLALAIAVICLVLLRRPRLALFAVAALSAHAMGAVLKYLVDRHRPEASLVDTVRFEEAYSYPSGHVEWVVSFEGFVVFAIWQLTSNALIRWAAVAVWLTHLFFTSIGRIDQGLHWPSDVYASYFVGAIALLAVIWAYRVSLRLFPANGAA